MIPSKRNINSRLFVKTLSFIAVIIAFSCISARKSQNPTLLHAETSPSSDKIIVAYVTSWSDLIPETDHITHINYAFGHVSESFDGVIIDYESRFREIVKLNEKDKKLKILLSIGGWGSGRFR